jgi:hypothetical protein
MAFKRGRKSGEVIDGDVHIGNDTQERISHKLEHVLVVEDKPQPKIKQYQKRLKQLADNKKYRKIAGLTVAGLVVLSALALYFGRNNKQPVAIPEGPKCGYQMLQKAKPNLDPKKVNVAKLEPQVQEIEQIPGYDQDPNCLFVALTYYIHISNAEKAKELFGKLERTYDPAEGYETVIVDVAQSPKELKPTVEFLQEQTKEFHGSFSGGEGSE